MAFDRFVLVCIDMDAEGMLSAAVAAESSRALDGSDVFLFFLFFLGSS